MAARGIDLHGQKVLVTGASRGIGRAVAEAFVACGADVDILADDPAVHAVAAEIGARGHLCDITDGAAVSKVAAALGRLDVLVNNAGLERMTPLDDANPEAEAVFRRILEINVTGTYLVTRDFLPAMEEGARIINTASIWGRVGEPLFGAYVASKHAVLGLTKAWAKELGPRGIRVNAVCPGWVRTEASMLSLQRMAARDGLAEDALLEKIVGGQALPGLMEPADVAGTYLFLASPLAATMTGQSVGADRGEVPW